MLTTVQKQQINDQSLILMSKSKLELQVNIDDFKMQLILLKFQLQAEN